MSINIKIQNPTKVIYNIHSSTSLYVMIHDKNLIKVM